ncbi:hypothetical protein AOZ06_27940 [Kibdelosporangium phytohabitans]|uniref:Uncharacterized protein n=1 Tax=Kibdelosporangium phytohabitans TaxID=860235 RepID=A0A0N9HSM1_9PSEU|nr:hypothetical protein AOZ06_27940 [Kibdelosporangium phytohabitans]
MRIFNTDATIVHTTHEGEHVRRQAIGLGHVNSLALLDVLMDLPVGTPVPISSVDTPNLRVLRKAPGGVVRVAGSAVTRLLMPVVTPVLAVVYASGWRDGLADASEFASYLPRMFVVDELPGNSDEALAEASWYGIGVAVGPPSAPAIVLEPEPLPDWQPTAAWWRFCERVYGFHVHGESVAHV